MVITWVLWTLVFLQSTRLHATQAYISPDDGWGNIMTIELKNYDDEAELHNWVEKISHQSLVKWFIFLATSSLKQNEIKVLDHIIIGEVQYFSFADDGLIKRYNTNFDMKK